MKRYETILIIDPDISEADRTTIVDKLKEVISKQKGDLVLVDPWGTRKLAYMIKKKNQGYYIRIDYCGNGVLVDELERLLQIDDRILKFMTILLDKNTNLEKIKEELSKPAPVKKTIIKDISDESDSIDDEEIEEMGSEEEKE